MKFRLFFLCLLILFFPISSNAQFIGIKIGMPPGTQWAAIGGGGGGGIPSGSLQDDSGHYLNDDAANYLISG